MELNKYLNAEPMTSIEYGACDKLVNFRKYSKYIVVIYISNLSLISGNES